MSLLLREKQETEQAMREQRKSELFKRGSEGSHRKAQDRLCKILIDNGWEIFPDSKLKITVEFNSQEGTNLMMERRDQYPWESMSYYHEFDIFAKKYHDNGLTSERIFEIDGAAHTKKVQQGKDKTAKEYAEFFLPDASFYRVEIGLLLDKKVSDEEIVSLYKLK